MKSLRRKGAGEYRHYLRSGAWFARRARWLDTHREGDGRVGCVVCRVRLTGASAQLHHTDYGGVRKNVRGRWVAAEQDGDLVAMCSACHEDLHHLFDTNRSWTALGRRNATRMATAWLQRQLAIEILAELDDEGDL